MKIALAQLDIVFGEPDANFAKVADFVQQAAARKCEVVVFPEMWNTGYALTKLSTLADKNGKRTQNFLSAQAADNSLAIIGGSVATKRNEHFYNTSYIFDASGKPVSSYDKVHLFGLMHEEKHITAGSKKNVFPLAGIPSVQVICYDIRFPEWTRTLMSNGAKILYVVAEWPDVRITQWKILLRARAVENQAFVVAVNRVGHDPENTFNGHSLVIDPLGEIIADAGETENLTTATLDLSALTAIRGQIPVFSDRRPELYK